jgi:hypothetical protein
MREFLSRDGVDGKRTAGIRARLGFCKSAVISFPNDSKYGSFLLLTSILSLRERDKFSFSLGEKVRMRGRTHTFSHSNLI